jgi:hypothetical protein
MHSPGWPRRGSLLGSGDGEARQTHFDRAALTGLAVDLDVAAGLLDEAVDLAEPKPGALPGLFGGEERLEGALADRLGHSRAGVGDGDLHVLPRTHVGILAAIGVVEIGVAGFDGQFAAVRHRIAGIDGEIEDCGFELRRIGFDRPDPASADDFERHIFAERAAEKIRQPVEQPIDVDRGRIERLLPGERQQPLGQGCRALRAVHRAGNALGELQVHRVGPGFELALRRLQIADDDGEQIIEVMGDAAGQMADGIELLRLP